MTDNKPKQNKNMKKKTYENQARTDTHGMAWPGKPHAYVIAFHTLTHILMEQQRN